MPPAARARCPVPAPLPARLVKGPSFRLPGLGCPGQEGEGEGRLLVPHGEGEAIPQEVSPKPDPGSPNRHLQG